MVHAVVREWNEDEGWGVVDSPETPGGCWAHFSAIETPRIERSDSHEPYEYAVLRPNETVELVWEQFPQDGFEHRAVALKHNGPAHA